MKQVYPPQSCPRITSSGCRRKSQLSLAPSRRTRIASSRSLSFLRRRRPSASSFMAFSPCANTSPARRHPRTSAIKEQTSILDTSR